MNLSHFVRTGASNALTAATADRPGVVRIGVVSNLDMVGTLRFMLVILVCSEGGRNRNYRPGGLSKSEWVIVQRLYPEGCGRRNWQWSVTE